MTNKETSWALVATMMLAFVIFLGSEPDYIPDLQPEIPLPQPVPTPTPDPSPAPVVDEWQSFWWALAYKESKLDASKVGDRKLKHKAYGIYQIRYPYWLDAVEYDPSLKGEFMRVVTDPAYAQRVCIAYFKRHCSRALANRDWNFLARIHNGGPRGPSQRATRDYALDVLWLMRERLRRAGR